LVNHNTKVKYVINCLKEKSGEDIDVFNFVHVYYVYRKGIAIDRKFFFEILVDINVLRSSVSKMWFLHYMSVCMCVRMLRRL